VTGHTPWLELKRDRELVRRYQQFHDQFRTTSDRLWVGMFAAEFLVPEDRDRIGELNPGGTITGHRAICMAQVGLPFATPIGRRNEQVVGRTVHGGRTGEATED
jgi:hypothetical protein